MERVRLEKFCFEHLDLFEWREEDRKTYGIRSEVNTALTQAAEKGECWTAIYDGRIMVIGGILKHTEKTGYCFTIFSRFADTNKIGAAKTVRRMFRAMFDDMLLHRVVTYNRVDAGNHHKWCEWLGFKKEGIIRKFDDEGNDYYQYGLVRD